jgi:DNA-binding PadR family transcriptional regulator
MTPREILAFLSDQAAPVDIEYIIGHFGIKLFEPRCAMLETMLLRLIDDGARVCEPLGPFKGYAITDAGREELKPKAKKPAQMAMF